MSKEINPMTRRMRFIFQLSVVLQLMLIIFAQRIYPQAIDDGIVTTASSALQTFLNKIPPGQEGKYGFRDRGEFLRATTATPVRLFTLHPDSIKNGITPGKNYLIPQEEWRVPVLVDGEYRALITVARTGGILKAVELGAAELAHELGVFEKNHPSQPKSILRLYQLQCDFLVLTHPGKTVAQGDVYPFKSAGFVFQGFDVKTPQTIQHALPAIRQKYAEKLRLKKQ
jgi:hypothetical protein